MGSAFPKSGGQSIFELSQALPLPKSFQCPKMSSGRSEVESLAQYLQGRGSSVPSTMEQTKGKSRNAGLKCCPSSVHLPQSPSSSACTSCRLVIVFFSSFPLPPFLFPFLLIFLSWTLHLLFLLFPLSLLFLMVSNPQPQHALRASQAVYHQTASLGLHASRDRKLVNVFWVNLSGT